MIKVSDKWEQDRIEASIIRKESTVSENEDNKSERDESSHDTILIKENISEKYNELKEMLREL